MKNGKPCGFTRIEDFTGSSEIALFGEPWLKWCNMMKVGNFLFIKAKCIQNRYMPERVDFVINSIDLLQDVKDTAINSMQISMPLSLLDKEFVSDIDTLTRTEGNVTLKFELSDGENRVSLSSAGRRIAVTQELVSYLKARDAIDLSFNK
jgi:DNA polymerase-3 subunit alpha